MLMREKSLQFIKDVLAELKSFHEKDNDEATTEKVALLIAAKIDSQPDPTGPGYSLKGSWNFSQCCRVSLALRPK